MPKELVNYKHNVEAVLFSTGRKMSVEEITKLCKILKEDALVALKELQADYNARNSSLMVVDEGDFWKLTVRERHLQVVKKIVAETELPKSIIETLAVVAWKAPVLQSDIIKIRTNKAYDHLKELEASGYITRQKKGRTNLIRLAQKFFQYFDLPPEKLQQMFKSITEMEQAILEKEKQVEQIKMENKAKEEELKKQQELAKKMAEVQIIEDEVDLISDKGEKVKLEAYGNIEEESDGGKVQEITEKEVAEIRTETKAVAKHDIEEVKKEKEQIIKPVETKSSNLDIPEDLVDKRVKELMQPEKEMQPDIEDVEEIKENIEKEKIKKSKKLEEEDLLEAAMEETKEETKLDEEN